MLSLLPITFANLGCMTHKHYALRSTPNGEIRSAMVDRRSIDAPTQLKVVAAEANVSEAMVTKIAKKLGFDGFRSLRTETNLSRTMFAARTHEERW